MHVSSMAPDVHVFVSLLAALGNLTSIPLLRFGTVTTTIPPFSESPKSCDSQVQDGHVDRYLDAEHLETPPVAATKVWRHGSSVTPAASAINVMLLMLC